MSRVIHSALFITLLVGCGSLAFPQEKPAAPPEAKATEAKEPGFEAGAAKPLAPQAAKDAVPVPGVAVDKSYVIGPEDHLAVRVWREPELSGQFMVRPDGRISLPLVNEIQAAGLTPEQLASSIALSLARYMNHPEVSIAVAQVNSRKFYIQGEVQKPGAYSLAVPTTVLEALVNAGGFREFANTKKITILRGGKNVLKFNYKDVTRGKNTEQNVLLQPGDQIIVR
jgi:polysaccharide biosynthesis/export protein